MSPVPPSPAGPRLTGRGFAIAMLIGTAYLLPLGVLTATRIPTTTGAARAVAEAPAPAPANRPATPERGELRLALLREEPCPSRRDVPAVAVAPVVAPVH
jgi:hypothetical protein